MQKREQRLTANTTRLKDRLEQVELENSELKQEVRILEQHRLENGKTKKADTALAMTVILKVVNLRYVTGGGSCRSLWIFVLDEGSNLERRPDPRGKS